MFDVGWSELMVIGGVALVVIGPKDIPYVVRSVSGFVRKARMLASDFQQTLTEAADQADIKELRKQLIRDADDFKQTVASVDLVNRDAIANATTQLGETMQAALQAPDFEYSNKPVNETASIASNVPEPAEQTPKKVRKSRAKKETTG